MIKVTSNSTWSILKLLMAPDHAGIEAMDEYVKKVTGDKAIRDVRTVAEMVIEECRRLAGLGLIDFAKAEISIHKVHGDEWDVAMVRYKDRQHWYHIEIIKMKEKQLSLL